MDYRHLKVCCDDAIPVASFCKSRLIEVDDVAGICGEIVSLHQLGEKIVLDLSNVEFLAEGIFGGLVTLHKKLKGSGGKLVLCGAMGSVLEKMCGYGLHNFFNIAKDKEMAFGQF